MTNMATDKTTVLFQVDHSQWYSQNVSVALLLLLYFII